MWEALSTFFQGTSVLKRVVIHCAIVLGFLLSVWGVSGLLELRAQRFGNGWRKQLEPVTCTQDPKALELPSSIMMVTLKTEDTSSGSPDLKSVGQTTPVTASPLKSATKGAEARLAGQFHEIQQRIGHHFDQMITYYSYSFATTIMVGVLAAVAAIALLFITLNGWGPSSEYQKTVFLVATVAATYCAAFPGVFQLQKNIDDNRYLYLKYVGLANEMCSYQFTAETPDTEAIEPSQFIHQIDNDLTTLNKIAVGFEVSQIPDFNKALAAATGSPRTPDGKSAAKSASKTKRTSPQQ